MSLPEEWESAFKEADLVEGRRLYTEGLVRQIELKPENAEAVTRTETQTVRAVIEINGAKLEWRTSLPEEENGAPFAVASIYEIEELIADEIPAIDESAAAAAPELPRGHGELVLVVDDEPAVRQITQLTLETFGYRVLVAVDGSDAVAVYARRGDEIAVVLTDMMMPVMDGPATIRVLRKMNPLVRIIAASGLDANAYGAGLGITHVLPKPYAADRLLTTLRDALAVGA